MWKERWTTSLAYIISPPDNSYIKEKGLNTKTIITYKTPTTIGQKLTSYKHLFLNQTKNKPKVRQGLANTVHFITV